MNSSKRKEYVALNSLMLRMESLVESILNLPETIEGLGRFGPVRYKPLFSIYNSCIEEFESLYPGELDFLGLEELPLYDDQGNERFTANKLSTLLHQAKLVHAALQGRLPPFDSAISLSDKVTLPWLWKNVPASFWVWVAGVLFAVLSLGVYLGQTSWVQELIGKKQAVISSQQTTSPIVLEQRQEDELRILQIKVDEVLKSRGVII